MGFVSGSGMFDGPSPKKEDGGDDKDLDDLNGKVEEVTKKVALAVFQGNQVHQNRLYQHLILT